MVKDLKESMNTTERKWDVLRESNGISRVQKHSL